MSGVLDPDGYALMVNIARRHMTKGQQAMVIARAQSLVSKEHGAQVTAAKAAGISEARVSQANTVMQYAPDLVDGVMAGAD
jgi:hypothetical protein